MKSAIDDKAFRNWKIPECYITGSFPEIQAPEKRTLTTLDTKSKKWLDYEQSIEKRREEQLMEQPKKPKEIHNKNQDKQEPWSVSMMLESASVPERRAILKSMFLSNPQILKYTLRQALAPDAQKKIHSWLNIASNQDKKMGTQFFNRLLTNKGLCDDDRYFIQHILELIKEEEDYWLTKPPHPQFSEPGDGTSRLKYIDLQSPEARKQRWMYKTWNHMPPYQDAEVYQCTSSHYTVSNKPMPSTYKIHPEMG